MSEPTESNSGQGASEQVARSIAIPVVADDTTTPHSEASHPRGPRKKKLKAESSQKLLDSNDEFRNKSLTQKLEREAWLYHQDWRKKIEALDGRYLRDEHGDYHLLLQGKRIPLNYERENHELNSLLLAFCKITIHAPAARPTIARIIDDARTASGKFLMRKFSAMSKDGKRLYVPLKDPGQLLRISTDEIVVVSNGDNDDSFYVEHPDLDPESRPFDYQAGDPSQGLEEFERLAVRNQATTVAAMSWFVAMQEGLFPFVRGLHQDRLIVMHEGPQGSGKTTGAALLCQLHGLGGVIGDASVAALNRLGDCGLLVMDNREQANMTQAFNDFVLFLATGGSRLRSSGENEVKWHNRHRPVGVLTSIEGAYKAEVIDRIVEVSYNAQRRDRANFRRKDISIGIAGSRNRILSALMAVLQQFFRMEKQDQDIQVPESLARFGDNYRTLVGLLHAYAQVAGKPPGWADDIVKVWSETITIQSNQGGVDELEQAVQQLLRSQAREQLPGMGPLSNPSQYNESCTSITYQGQAGTLTVLTCEQLMDGLRNQDRYNNAIPRRVAALGRRLRNLRSPTLRVLDEQNAPELPQLKRKKNQRFIGLFEPDDA